MIVLGGTLGAVMLQSPIRVFEWVSAWGDGHSARRKFRKQKMVYQLSAWKIWMRRDWGIETGGSDR